MRAKKLPWIDFKRYRQDKYLRAVTSWLWRVHVWDGAKSARSHCPLCLFQGKGRARVGWWNFTTGFFYCHKCEAKRDAIGMVCELKKCNAVEAVRWLEEKAGAAGSGFIA